MTNITLKQFKNSAKRFHEKNGFVLNLTYTQSLQELSQILFSKTFEEAQVTLFKNENPFTVVSYNNNFYIFEYKKFISSYNNLNSVQQFFENSCFLFDQKNIFHIPYIGDLSFSKLVKYFKKYGVFDTKKSLILNIETAKKIFIDDRFCEYHLNGDWIGEVETNAENEDEEPLNTCVWFAETNEGYDLYEYYISFEDILNAEYLDNNEWLIKQDNRSIIIKIYS